MSKQEEVYAVLESIIANNAKGKTYFINDEKLYKLVNKKLPDNIKVYFVNNGCFYVEGEQSKQDMVNRISALKKDAIKELSYWQNKISEYDSVLV